MFLFEVVRLFEADEAAFPDDWFAFADLVFGLTADAAWYAACDFTDDKNTM